jgi:signal peptidase I
MTSDPIPEEQLPPRFEPLVGGSDPDVQRLEALKRTLGEDIPAAPPSAAGYLPEPPPEVFEQVQEEPEEEEPEEEELSRRARRKQKRKNRSFWQELPILILVALVVAIVIKTFFFQAFYIPSGSMIPTLEINDRVLVNKMSYRFGAVERGDILVFDSPEAIDIERSFVSRVARSIGEATGLTSPDTVLIKRVIGLPGETVEVRDNQVYVNGNPIAEPYLPDGIAMRDFEELVIPADHVFMMGDNRNQSRDSRVFGPIPREDIVGRAFVTVWPPGAWGGL